jgi:hypothetical protein
MNAVSTPPAHNYHYAQPRALEQSKGKSAESPAFQARAGLGESGEVPFGKLVSEIAKARKDAPVDPVTPETPPATGPSVSILA